MTDDDRLVPYRRQPVDLDPPLEYASGPDSAPRASTRPGRVERFRLEDSRVYPGVSRDVHVHVPAACDAGEPAGIMVFQDGWMYLDPDQDMRAGIVLDNLVEAGEMPATIGVFVDPGSPGNRNVEYDATDSRYVDLLLEEVVPRVRAIVDVVDDPARWAICGGSSGGNGAFTAAWLRPDRFGKVMSFVGSFAQIPGGDPYPRLIRSTPPKPIRVFQQVATRDLGFDRPEGNWFAENLLVAAALAERGYDHRLVLGDGGHSANHGGAILPDAMRWLWR